MALFNIGDLCLYFEDAAWVSQCESTRRSDSCRSIQGGSDSFLANVLAIPKDDVAFDFKVDVEASGDSARSVLKSPDDVVLAHLLFCLRSNRTVQHQREMIQDVDTRILSLNAD